MLSKTGEYIMKWLKNFLFKLKLLIGKIKMSIKIHVVSKPKRPKVHKIWSAEIVDGDIVFSEKYIIINYKGETMEAPIFDSKKSAEEWLDLNHPANKYSLG